MFLLISNQFFFTVFSSENIFIAVQEVNFDVLAMTQDVGLDESRTS